MHEITEILVDLFIIFTAAKIAGGLFARLKQPSIVGEVLVGILIGPYVLGWVGVPNEGFIHLFGGDETTAHTALTLTLDVLAELGVILLLFFVGLETRVSELMQERGRALLVGALGILFPFVFGFAFMWFTGRGGLESAFVATAMVSTSIGITARVLGDIGVLRQREARIILGAAVVDDVLGLLLLSVVSSTAGGDVNVLELLLTIAEVALFFAFVVLIGTRIVRRYSVHLERVPLRNASLMVTLVVMLGFSALAGSIGLAAIIGAFLAGLMLSEAKERYDLEHQAKPIYEFLTPFFFVVTGTKVDIAALQDPGVLGLALGVTALAILGKLVGGRLASLDLPARSALIIGVGMVPRGEVGLVVASIGISLGVISGDVFSAVVFMSLATTLLAPPALIFLHRHPKEKAVDIEPLR
jgi:Kef-type K+ transport system membrane component KefB